MPAKTAPPPKRSSSRYQRVKLRVESALGVLDRMEIVPFRGFGGQKTFVLEGRVLERKGISKPTKKTGRIENIRNTLRRFDSDELPDAVLRATFRGKRYETTTDREGYFAFQFDAAGASRAGWHTAKIELLESLVGGRGISTRGAMLLPSPNCEYAVVSDVDDTIMCTGAAEPTTMVRMVLSENARTRTAFPGAARLYHALEQGPDGRGRNPVFYLSRTGWNLYDLFEMFLERNGFPSGPLLLRDLSIFEKASERVSNHNHKIGRIEQILKMYPSLPLVLIGDSGQQDPETYLELSKKHSRRIRAVYLRDVTRGKRDREVVGIVKQIMKLGIPALATDDTLALAVHAERAALLRTRSLEYIRAARDEALTGATSPVFR
jgi:phosphatidate phosphatase APP1